MRAPILLPVLATTLALAVSGCGSDDGSSSGVSASSGGATSSAKIGTKEVSGTGYRTTVPTGWRDYSEATEGTAVRVDLLYGERETGTFATNVVVTREDPDAVAGKRVTEVADQIREQAATAVGADVPDADEGAALGGEDAEQWVLRREVGGRSVAQRQLVAIHDDALYTITLSALDDDADAQAQFDTVVAGWRWD